MIEGRIQKSGVRSQESGARIQNKSIFIFPILIPDF